MSLSLPREYLSDKEYRFHEDQADAIVQTTAYRCDDFSQSLIFFKSREHSDIRSSIINPFQRASGAGLGSLGRLPLELLFDILLRLDMQSLFRFRQTNLRWREMVYHLRQYRMVVSHGLNLFCALLRTRFAVNISLIDFYRALCTKECAICGEFGGFVSLLTWTRCCFQCLRRAAETRVQSLASARKQFRLGKVQTARLKSLKTLPGSYTREGSVYKSRIRVVSVHQAMSVSGLEPRVVAQETPADWHRNAKLNFMGSCALPYYDRRTGKVDDGVACAGCQLAVEKRMLGSRGLECAYEARDRIYTRDGFLEHFRRCRQAQLLWRSSGEGKHEPAELPFIARMRRIIP